MGNNLVNINVYTTRKTIFIRGFNPFTKEWEEYEIRGKRLDTG